MSSSLVLCREPDQNDRYVSKRAIQIMNFKNVIIGVAIGSIIVVLIKPTETGDLTTSVAVHTTANANEPQSVVTTVAVDTGASVMTIDDRQPQSQLVEAKRTLDDSLRFDHNPSRLRQLLQESIEAGHVANPTQSEIDEFEQLFLATLQRSEPWTKIAQGWNRGGWKLENWTSDGEKFLAVCEQGDQRRGRGIYVLRVDSQSPLALQAPHRFFDTKTGLLTRKLFTENDVLVAAWNTVHREQFDLAHRSDHYINAMTRALIKFNTSTVIAQVHGFANEKQSGAARSAAVIISDTTQYPGRLVRRTAEGLKQRFGFEEVRLYPSEVSQLGGTQNHQARVFHRFGQQGFLHVELNQQLRGKLVSDASMRAEFFAAFTGAVANRHIPPNR